MCVSRKNLFSNTQKEEEEISEGGHTVSRVILFERFENALVSRDRETRTERDTHRQRDDRDLTLETSDRGRFSLSLSLRKSARERVKNRSRRTHRTRKRRDFSRLRDTKTISPPPEWKSAAKGKDILKIGK